MTPTGCIRRARRSGAEPVAQRLAVIADCHGNADALRAVLADIDREGAARIYNLGDHASGPLAAQETLSLLRGRADMLSIRGNHDRYLLGDPARMGPSDAVARAQLGAAELDWLAALPATAREGEVHLCHGVPTSDLRYWMQAVTSAGQVVLRPLAEVASEIPAGEAAEVHLCGHSHLPGSLQVPQGSLIVNPGSVGLPAYDDHQPVPHVVESGDPAARYALIERGAAGWVVSHRRVPYDPSRMVALARRHGREDWAHALATGWFPRSPAGQGATGRPAAGATGP